VPGVALHGSSIELIDWRPFLDLTTNRSTDLFILSRRDKRLWEADEQVGYFTPLVLLMTDPLDS